MQTEQHNLFTRPDTFFGVCEGLGEDLHIPPTLLRVALAGVLFFNPPAAIAAYVTGGAIVLSTRLLFPKPKAAVPQAAEAPVEMVAPAEPAEAAREEAPIPLAA